MELECPKIEIDESNTHEIHLNSLAIDYEIEEVPIESVAAPDNKNSSVNTEKSFKCQLCDLQFSNESCLHRHKNNIHPVVPKKAKLRLHENVNSDDQQFYGHFHYEGRLWVPPKMKKKKGPPKKDGSLYMLDRNNVHSSKEKKAMGRPLKNLQGCQTKAEYEHAKTCWIKFLKNKGIEIPIKEQQKRKYRKKERIKDFPLIDEEIQEIPIEPKMETDDDSSQIKSHDLNLEAVIENHGIDVPLAVSEPEFELELPKFEIDDSNTTEAFPTSSAVDQEKHAIPMESKSVAEQKNHESVKDLSEFDEDIQQCSMKCSKCGELYSDPKVLSKHILVCNPRGRKAAAEQLSINTSSKPKTEPSGGDTKSSASSSPSTCLAKTPISCSICGSHWKTPSALDIHMRVHTGEKPYKCSICGKRYTQKCHLKVDHNLRKSDPNFLSKYLGSF